MKKNFPLPALTGLFILLTSFSVLSQPKLAPGFRYNGIGSIQITEKNWETDVHISFAVYDDGKVLEVSSTNTEYKAADILGFTHKESGKKFVSATQGKLLGYTFVEDITPDNKRFKVAKAFLADTPLMQKDSVIMGSWLYYALFIKDDGSRQLISGFKKIGETVKADCPELSKKISAKEKGYFLGMLSGSPAEQLEIYHRIAAEYEQCMASKN